MNLPSTIAIDGPSGAGKSVLGESLARRLGYRYIDTGALYRATTLAALQRGVAQDDSAALGLLAETVDIDIRFDVVHDGRQYTVLLDGVDVTWRIRESDVERAVSAVSAVPQVRIASVRQQRRLAARGEAVLVGRDIGTVVLPDADLKIFLTASPTERAHRRHSQLAVRGKGEPFETILEDLKKRDALDSERAESPLRQAPDAKVLDSDGLSIDETLEAALVLVEGARKPCPHNK